MEVISVTSLLDNTQYANKRVLKRHLYIGILQKLEKISDALRKHTRSEEHKANIGKSSKGRRWSEESRIRKSKQISCSGNPRAGRWKIENVDGTSFEINYLNTWCLNNDIKIGTMHKAKRENRFHKGFRVSRIY